VIIPLVMSQTVRLHPAVIAIGVVVVGQLFGVAGLFVAVPVLSLLVISVDEFWVRQIEENERDRIRSDIELPSAPGTEIAEPEQEPIRPAS
jgi:predicted PurR-regulated permease PerM